MTDKLELVDWDRYYVPKSGEFVYDTVGRGKPRLVAINPNKKGYLTASLVCTDGERRKFSVHRLVAWKYVPLVDGKTQVNHIDGVKTNNDASNLEWSDNADNVQHAFDNGLMVGLKGEQQKSSKLTEEMVYHIRGMHRMGLTQKALAEHFGVSAPCIGYVVRNETWRHLL